MRGKYEKFGLTDKKRARRSKPGIAEGVVEI
jgi:hypothetical protein